MKKTMAYLVTGILLGVALMFLPRLSYEIGGAGQELGRWQGYGPPTDYTTIATGNKCPDEAYEGLSGTEQPKDINIDNVDSIGVFPSSLIYVGLISVISLIFALGVYAFSKRYMIT